MNDATAKSHRRGNLVQASRRAEQMDCEALLLRAGANDADLEFSRDISLPASQHRKPQFTDPAQNVKEDTSMDRPGPGSSSYSLNQSIHAKPFVPNGETQQVCRRVTTFLWAFLLSKQNL